MTNLFNEIQQLDSRLMEVKNPNIKDNDFLMSKSVFNHLSKRMIKNIKARKAAYLYLFEGYSAYQAEIEIFGSATVTIKKIVDRLRAEYRECLNVAMLSDRPKMHMVGSTIKLKALEDLEVYAFVYDGSLTALQCADSSKDLSDLLDIDCVYEDIMAQLESILMSGQENFKLDF